MASTAPSSPSAEAAAHTESVAVRAIGQDWEERGRRSGPQSSSSQNLTLIRLRDLRRRFSLSGLTFSYLGNKMIFTLPCCWGDQKG